MVGRRIIWVRRSASNRFDRFTTDVGSIAGVRKCC